MLLCSPVASEVSASRMQMTSVLSEFPVLDEIPRADEAFDVDVEAVLDVKDDEFKHCCNFFNCVSIVSILSRKLSESCKANKNIIIHFCQKTK